MLAEILGFVVVIGGLGILTAFICHLLERAERGDKK